MFENMSYAAKWTIGLFIAGCLALAILLAWINIFGPLFNQADYNNYNNSPQHLQAVSQKFSDDCLQLASTTDPTSRKALEQDIYSVSATVDLKLVQMPDGVRSCVNQAIADVTTKGK